MKKDITEQEAFLQLAALCAQAEHCEQEMRDKLKRWELDTAAADRIIARLQKERYIDDARYARAFVKDKIRYNKWGAPQGGTSTLAETHRRRYPPAGAR